MSITRLSEVVSGVPFVHLVELFTLIKMVKWNASSDLCGEILRSIHEDIGNMKMQSQHHVAKVASPGRLSAQRAVECSSCCLRYEFNLGTSLT